MSAPPPSPAQPWPSPLGRSAGALKHPTRPELRLSWSLEMGWSWPGAGHAIVIETEKDTGGVGSRSTRTRATLRETHDLRYPPGCPSQFRAA